MMPSRLVILHGYLATPADHWFGWLARRFESSGTTAHIPALPESSAPRLDAWIESAVATIGRPDSDTAIVGHSLGVVTALHALDTIEGDWELGALVGVSGFVAPLPTIPEIDGFTATRPDLERTASRTRSRALVLSDDDAIVPPQLTLDLANELRAETVVVPGGGHFLALEGFVELPAAAELLVAR